MSYYEYEVNWVVTMIRPQTTTTITRVVAARSDREAVSKFLAVFHQEEFHDWILKSQMAACDDEVTYESL